VRVEDPARFFLLPSLYPVYAANNLLFPETQRIEKQNYRSLPYFCCAGSALYCTSNNESFCYCRLVFLIRARPHDNPVLWERPTNVKYKIKKIKFIYVCIDGKARIHMVTDFPCNNKGCGEPKIQNMLYKSLLIQK
jgi:hypothetical protein